MPPSPPTWKIDPSHLKQTPQRKLSKNPLAKYASFRYDIRSYKSIRSGPFRFPKNRIDTVIHAAPAVLRQGPQGRRPQGRHETVLCARGHAEAIESPGQMSAIAGKTCEKAGCGRRSICSLTQVRRPVLPQLFRCVWYVQRRAISRLHPAGADFLPELLPLISELRSAAFVWRNAAPEPRHRKDSPHLGGGRYA